LNYGTERRENINFVRKPLLVGKERITRYSSWHLGWVPKINELQNLEEKFEPNNNKTAFKRP